MTVRCLIAAIVIALAPKALLAQAPLITDDAAVAALRMTHVEFFAQLARLSRSLSPAVRQSTMVLTVGYGVTSRLEAGFDFPLIVIHREGGRSSGTGDLNLTVKYLLHMPVDSTAPRYALAAAMELPTGDAVRGFGSGVADFGANLIGEWRPAVATVLRVNVGMQFAGNTLTGLVGIRDRGVVANAGASLSRVVSSRATLVGELTGYQGRSRVAADRELRLQGGLLYAITDRHVLAISVQRGWLASPPVTLQIGGSIDFRSRFARRSIAADSSTTH